MSGFWMEERERKRKLLMGKENVQYRGSNGGGERKGEQDLGRSGRHLREELGIL